ncbi:MAG: hypothetical protein VX738_08125 [Planctomycetota bacterium]|nr:hypothetical protein [Planctomycetota bacterium]
MNTIARFLGVEEGDTLHDVSLQFVSFWAEGRPVLVILLCLALAAVGCWFYVRFQQDRALDKRPRRKIFLACSRGFILALIGFILAEPVISVSLTEHPRPLLLVLLDTSDSMNLDDEHTSEEADQIFKMLGDQPKLEEATRLDLLNMALRQGKLVDSLSALDEEFDLRFYSTEQGHTIREVSLEQEDVFKLQAPLTADLQTTAIGSSLDELHRRHGTRHLAGVVIASDFSQNAGNPAISSAEQLAVPLFTTGIGPREVIDVAIQLQTPLVLKQDERTSVTATVRQQGVVGDTIEIQLYERLLGTGVDQLEVSSEVAVGPPVLVVLTEAQSTIDLPYLPTASGRFELVASVAMLPGEASERNNRAAREILVRDESLNLFFVEYEPTWEWRFVKEVFQRDPLIGEDGFRTYLQSADFKVSQSNDLFVERLIRPRDEFFANDVVLISDVPGDMLTKPFQDQLAEYVERFGGGLVVIAGPRFGISSLQGTQLAEMLPVVVDRSLQPKPSQFALALTPEAAGNPFVNLGDTAEENMLAWTNMGDLPWYQPVLRPHPLATVLATHPTDKTVDREQLQPLIATRRYGKGEVIYIGFNETWRLRKKYGERFYRQFWGQMIYRLGLGRALGQQKRFSPSTDLTTYQTGERVTVTVEAYSKDYKELSAKSLSGRLLRQTGSSSQQIDEISIPMARDNVVFETSIAALEAGSYRLMILDPETDTEFEIGFEVAAVSRERLDVVRNTPLQQQLADVTGGQACELYELPELLDGLEAKPLEQYSHRQLPLWNTWLMLILVLTMMHTEWLVRKLSNLR